MGGITKGPVATSGYELRPGEFAAMMHAERTGDVGLDPCSAAIAERCQLVDDRCRALAKMAINDPAYECLLPGYSGPSDSKGCHELQDAEMQETVDV